VTQRNDIAGCPQRLVSAHAFVGPTHRKKELHMAAKKKAKKKTAKKKK
jgi:hypothetical protein